MKGPPALHYHARMLNHMRNNLKHLKWVLVVVALALLGYLGSYFDPRVKHGGGASDWAARVDGHSISTVEFLQVARTQDEYYRRLLGPQYDQMKQNLRIGSQTIQSLVDRHLVLGEARALGLRATKEEISKEILENPSFKDASGNFVGKERYADFIGQSYDGGVEAYERRLADDLLARKWMEVMTASARVSDAELEHAWRARNVRAAADYVFVPSSTVSFDTSLDPAAVSAWYASHKDDYRRSEARKLRLVLFDRQGQIADAKVSDADLRAEYDAHAADYARPEQRRARHILLKIPAGAAEADKRSVRDLAGSVLLRVQKGEDFAALARSMSQDPGSAPQGGELGWFGRGAMVKPFDDAVFSTPPGQFAGPVETPYGFHVIQVEEAREAGAAPFEEVRDALKRRLELQQAQRLTAAKAQAFASEAKTLAEFEAAAKKAGYSVLDRTVSAQDRAPDLGPSPEFTSAVSSMQAGQVSAPLGVANGLVVAACAEVLPPAVRPLAEVADQVKTDILNDRGTQAALVAARRIASAGTLEAAAKAQKLEVKKTGDVQSGVSLPGVGPAPALDTALFAQGTVVGSKGAVAVAGGAIAYVVTRHDAFDPAKFEAEKATLRGQLLQQRREQLAQGLIEALRQKHTVEINAPLVDGLDG
ncbi:MAG TPA: peptidyl-prolyl cis-trans isomerase [Candidatus Polarisedimenticolaceae bacterium]|nr:peptidyl-prolyl cis-trans isomerase [Candidatus Polarisedimenticolaceae bacterium]